MIPTGKYSRALTAVAAGTFINPKTARIQILGPVHADIHELDVIFAAIANAMDHATGKRINKLPIHFDELL